MLRQNQICTSCQRPRSRNWKRFRVCQFRKQRFCGTGTGKRQLRHQGQKDRSQTISQEKKAYQCKHQIFYILNTVKLFFKEWKGRVERPKKLETDVKQKTRDAYERRVLSKSVPLKNSVFSGSSAKARQTKVKVKHS